MKREKNKFNNIRFIFIILIFLLIIFSIGRTNSRYLSGASSDTDIIAKAILTLSNNEQIYPVEGVMLPGDSRIYEFSVANYDDINTNEILLGYHLQIISSDEESPLEVELENVTTSQKVALTNGKTPSIDLPYEGQQITNYKLTLKWDEKKRDIKYAGKSLKYTINLVAEQKTDKG